MHILDMDVALGLEGEPTEEPDQEDTDAADDEEVRWHSMWLCRETALAPPKTKYSTGKHTAVLTLSIRHVNTQQGLSCCCCRCCCSLTWIVFACFQLDPAE